MPWVLNAIYAAVLLLFGPILLYRRLRRGKYREGWNEKFLGQAPWRIGDRPCLWFHAVSVGEVLLLKPLVHEIARRRPHWQIVISTTTKHGAGPRPADLSRPGDVRCPTGLQLVHPAGDGAGPTDGPGTGGAGDLAQPDSSGEAQSAPGWRSSTHD